MNARTTGKTRPTIDQLLRSSDELIARALVLIARGTHSETGLGIDSDLRLLARRTRWDASELAECSHALTKMPSAASALDSGLLSFSQIRAIVRAARGVDLSKIDELIARRAQALAQAEPEQIITEVEDLAMALSQAKASSAEDRRVESSFLHLQAELTGGGTIFGRADSDAFASIATALEAASGPPQTDLARSEQTMEALLGICSDWMSGGSGGSARPRPRLLATFDTERGQASLLTPVPGKPKALDPRTTEQMLCDAELVAVSMEGATPVAVGRAVKTIPDAVRTAVTARDGGCRFPGCGAPASWSEVHHIKTRARGGGHQVANLVLLCRRHHRICHKRGVKIEHRSDGQIAFTIREGTYSSAPRARMCRRE